jgi:hypothetical protein
MSDSRERPLEIEHEREREEIYDMIRKADERSPED